MMNITIHGNYEEFSIKACTRLQIKCVKFLARCMRQFWVRNTIKLKAKATNWSPSREITHIRQLSTLPKEKGVTTHVRYYLILRWYVASAGVREIYGVPRRFSFYQPRSNIQLNREISHACLLVVAALMDAEPGVLGRQFRSAFRRAAERSNETALEGKLINRWNIHVNGSRARRL